MEVFVSANKPFNLKIAIKPRKAQKTRNKTDCYVTRFSHLSGRNLGKTNPLNDAGLAEFVELQKRLPKSWRVDAASIDPVTFDLSVNNPNGGKEIVHRSPQDILDEIAELDAESAKVLARISALP